MSIEPGVNVEFIRCEDRPFVGIEPHQRISRTNDGVLYVECGTPEQAAGSLKHLREVLSDQKGGIDD